MPYRFLALLLLLVAGPLAGRPAAAEEPEPESAKPGPFELVVETDGQPIPPLTPLMAVFRLKNGSAQKFLVDKDWIDTIRYRVYRGKVLVGENGYGNLHLFGNVPVAPLQDIAHAMTLYLGREESPPLFGEPGQYTVQATVSYGWQKEEAEESTSSDAAFDFKVTVRRPVKTELKAVKLLQESQLAQFMIWGAEDPRGFAGLHTSEEGARVLTELVKACPDTIYADFANYILGRTISATDFKRLPEMTDFEAQQEWIRLTDRERVYQYLSKVGDRSRLLLDRATLWKLFHMTNHPNDFPDADWNATVVELETLSEIAKLYGSEQWRTEQALPWAKEMRDKGRLDDDFFFFPEADKDQ